MIFRIVDIESTGIPSETERHAMVELGWCDLFAPDSRVSGDPVILEPTSVLCNPGRPIPIEAMAVHHIRDRDVAGAASPTEMLQRMMRHTATPPDYYAAHRADFERQFFGGGDTPWICTYKCALRLWPDAPGHSLQALRYMLELDDLPAFDREMAMPPHRAAPDTYVTAYLLEKILALAPIEKLLLWTSGPALLAKCGFGKHFGKTWAWVGENDRSYLIWITEKSDITDRDVRATAKFYLKKFTPQGATP